MLEVSSLVWLMVGRKATIAVWLLLLSRPTAVLSAESRQQSPASDQTPEQPKASNLTSSFPVATLAPPVAVATTNQASESPKRKIKRQSVGDIVVFVALTLGSYVVGAVLAIICRAFYNHVQNRYYRRKKAMLQMSQAIANGPQNVGRWRMNNRRRLSTIFEAPAPETEVDVSQTNAASREESQVAQLSQQSAICYATSNNSYDLFPKAPQRPVPPVPVGKSSSTPVASPMQQRSANSQISELVEFTSSPKRHFSNRREQANVGNSQNLSPPTPPQRFQSPSCDTAVTNFGVLASPSQSGKTCHVQSLYRSHCPSSPGSYRQPTYIIECFGVGENV